MFFILFGSGLFIKCVEYDMYSYVIGSCIKDNIGCICVCVVVCLCV